jgi:D-Tyr-tRNAtyr deacylase
VSQFTLHAVTAKGAKPDFHSLSYLSLRLILESMKGPEAKVLYGQVLDELGKGLPGGQDKVKGKLPLAYADKKTGCLER